MTELEIMERAKRYIDCLANGIDPLTGEEVKQDDVVNKVQISRCLFYVSGILQKNIEATARSTKNKKTDKADFELSYEDMRALVPDDRPISSAKITSLINSFVDSDKMKKLKVQTLNRWLVSAGLIADTEDKYGIRKIPTEAGARFGIKETFFKDESGFVKKYLLYPAEAQQLIFDNLIQVSEFARIDEEEQINIRDQKRSNSNLPWSQNDDNILRELYSQGAGYKTMEEKLLRTRKSIKARMNYLGLTEKQ